MANDKVESFVLHSGGTSTEYPVLDRETYEALLKTILRITPLENSALSHDEQIAAMQAAVTKLQETDTDAAESLKDLDARITKAQSTADSNTQKYSALNEVVSNEQTKLTDEIERAKDIEGDLNDLNTVVKDNLVAAINYLLTRAEKNAENTGTLANLETESKTDLVSAINELEQTKVESSEVDVLSTTVENAVAKVESLENTLNNQDYAGLQTQITNVSAEVGSLQTAVSAKADETDVSALDTRLTTAEGDIDNLETAIADKADKGTTLSSYGITDAVSGVAVSGSTMTVTKSDGTTSDLTLPSGGSSDGGNVTVDSALSSTSENPVQNKAIVAGGSAILNALDIETSTPRDGDFVVIQTSGGGETNATYKRKDVKALWLYIKSCLKIIMGITEDTFANKADKATTLAGYGITDGATKAEVKTVADSVTAVEGKISDEINLSIADEGYTFSSSTEITSGNAVVDAFNKIGWVFGGALSFTASGGTQTCDISGLTDYTLVDFFATIPNIAPSAVSQSDATLSVTFDAQDEAFYVLVMVNHYMDNIID